MSGLIPDRYVVPLTGTGKKRCDKFLEMISNNENRIFITNYESLSVKGFFEIAERWKPEVLVLDESHKCKDVKTLRTKLATKLADIAIHKYILTGTPVLNSPMDLFAQFRILDGGALFGKNFYQFRHHYFYDKNAGMNKFAYFPDWQIKKGAIEAINMKVYQVAMRVTKDECLDLPPLVNQVVYVEMSNEQRKIYDEMKKHFITFLNGQAVVAELAIVKALRLQQIVSGFVKSEKGEEIALENNNRINALSELLEDTTQASKVIVWAVFKKNYEEIKKVCKKLKLEYVEVHGDVSASQKDEAIRRFNEDENVRVYIGHPGSGGIGVNLTVSNVSIVYTRSFSLEQSLQSESRNHRGGSEIHKKITRIDIVTPDTIDELVMESLRNKESISEKVLQQIKFQN